MREVRAKREPSEVSNQGLIVLLGKPLLNTIWRLEQVLRESSKAVRIPWDSDKHENMWEVEK